MKFIFIRQQEKRDSGPTCLRMVSLYYGGKNSIQKIRDLAKTRRDGATLLGLKEAAFSLGFDAEIKKVLPKELVELSLPCILNWKLNIYVVLFKIKNGRYHIADPAKGIIRFSEQELIDLWYSRTEFAGRCLELNPNLQFEKLRTAPIVKNKRWFGKVSRLAENKVLIFQLILGFLFGSMFQLLAPFLTQSIVDQGINTQNIDLVYIVLFAQLMLFLGSTSVNFIRSWILLTISTKINITLLVEFLSKFMKLPLSFFETKTTGDLMQRMNDQQKIESFLTGPALNTVFSLFNLVLFSVLLAFYNSAIFYVFSAGTLLYGLWISLFLKPKRELNYIQFENTALNQSSVIDIITGIQDIKLTQAEQEKRWDWERLQVSLFKFKMQSLRLTQLQTAGSVFINQGKTLIITFLSVKAVIDGELTLGGMMAIQFIVGQINNPVEQFLAFVQGYQDAKISMERLNEIHELEDEQQKSLRCFTQLPEERSICFKEVSFRYAIAGSRLALDGVTFEIPAGKTTAIVGMSGSGKTTILKLLMRFYEPENGSIEVGGVNISRIAHDKWRSACGIVLPDAFIFSDTIANNISVGDPHPKREKIDRALKISNLSEFVDSLPSGLETRIGAGGNGISLGQKQRLMIARAVYKNPDFLFFDEATNALDSYNEETIVQNFKNYFKDKTVIVVAHRLSTVRDADQIIVVDKSRIAERGTHHELVELKGAYYKLVKNQLSLGI